MEINEKNIIVGNLIKDIISCISQNKIAIEALHNAYKHDMQKEFLYVQGFVNNIKMQCDFLIKFLNNLEVFKKEINADIIDYLTENLNFAENYFKEAPKDTNFIFLNENKDGNN